MAEAAIDVSSNISPLRYFCHECSQESSSVLPDYTCPRCLSGFIEEVGHQESEDISDHLYESEDPNDSDVSFERETPMADLLDNLYGPMRDSQTHSMPTNDTNGHPLGRSGSQPNVRPEPRSGSSSQRHSGNDANPRQTTRFFQLNFPRNPDSVGFENQQSLEGLFQHILTNLSGQLSGRDGGVNVGGRGLINIDFPLPLFQVLHGNPGDYAWGEGGLNEIISQLLNQLDGTGPPPMAKEDIDNLPFVSISEEQVRKNLQCTVCMEDFKVNEKVRQLMCTHCYHNECIVPWLQMHATCPVCRKELLTNRTSSNRDSVSTHSHTDSQMRDTSDSNASTQSSNENYESTDDYD